jgi:hypothetical protein
MFAYYNRWFSFAAFIGPFRIIHYLAFAGTFYIAFGVILFAVLKRRYPNKYVVFLRTHTLGNLLAPPDFLAFCRSSWSSCKFLPHFRGWLGVVYCNGFTSFNGYSFTI